jgi:hypothetical protein
MKTCHTWCTSVTCNLLLAESISAASPVSPRPVRKSGVIVPNKGDIEQGGYTGVAISQQPPGMRRRSSVQLTLNGGPNGRVESFSHPSAGLATENSMTVIEQFKMKKMDRQPSSKKSLFGAAVSAFANATGVSTRNVVAPQDDSMKLSEDFSHIYLFKSPEMYFRCVLASPFVVVYKYFSRSVLN